MLLSPLPLLLVLLPPSHREYHIEPNYFDHMDNERIVELIGPKTGKHTGTGTVALTGAVAGAGAGAAGPVQPKQPLSPQAAQYAAMKAQQSSAPKQKH